MKPIQRLLVVCLLVWTAAANGEFSPDLGGDTTVDVSGARAFRSVAANAAGMSRARFTFGQQLFNTVWEPAPGSQPTTDGLGPVFNRAACSDCHVNNGRGQPPASTGAPMESMLVRLSVDGQGPHGGPKAVPGYGGQLQDRGVDGISAEGRAVIEWIEQPGRYPDDEPYSLRSPVLKFVDLAFGDLPQETMASIRVASPLIGLGLLETVPEETLRALADPDDTDGNGISGRVNVVWDAVNNRQSVGRFGWKANQPSLRQQSAGAALGDMGLTSPVFPDDNCAETQTACQRMAADVADSPEIVAAFFDPLVTYTQLVAVPRQRDPDSAAVQAGRELFSAIGCAGCHVTTLETGDDGLEELSGQSIHPFTDLLLHDLGAGLADQRPDFLASGQEWRTPPLWGIGLTRQVSGFEFFLHDGRARSVEEAVLWHGGEAEAASEAFRHLDKDARGKLLTFLDSI